MWFPTMWHFDKLDSGEPVQTPLKLRNSKWCSVGSLILIEKSSDQQRLWSDCAYAQAGLRLCWSHIPHCWKYHAAAHIILCRKRITNMLIKTARRSLISMRIDISDNILSNQSTFSYKYILNSKMYKLVCAPIRAVWSESSMSALLVVKGPTFLRAEH